MSNDASGNAPEDARSPSAETETEQAAAQPPNRSNHQLPTPPRSSNASYDHSDAASMDSQNTTASRQRYKRGGRKKKKKKGGKLQSVSEFELPKGAQRQEQETSPGVESRDDNAPYPEDDDEARDYDAEELRKARSSRPAAPSKERAPGKATKEGGTGIRAFNIARAEGSGGGQPVGITIERPKSKDKTKGKGKENKKASGGKGGGEGEGQDGETETETRKPVSIRLDLNLEIEIFLRAKIQGDVTITFLE